MLSRIRQRGLCAGLALQLETPIERAADYCGQVDVFVLLGTRLGIKGVGLDSQACPRIAALRRLLRREGCEGKIKIQADGGIREQTVPQLALAGADIVTPVRWPSRARIWPRRRSGCAHRPDPRRTRGGEATMLIAMAGLPATGKSTIARALAVRLDAVLLDKDEIRAALFAPQDIEYSRPQDDFCMGILYQVAAYLLRKEPSRRIIVDGRPFSKRYQIERLTAFAAEIAAPLKLVECTVSDEDARRRLEAQSHGEHLAANRNFSMYLGMKQQAEPIEQPRLVLDTSALDLAASVERAAAYILGG